MPSPKVSDTGGLSDHPRNPLHGESGGTAAQQALARYSAAIALLALVVGGVAMSVSSAPGASTQQVLTAVRANPLLHGGAAVALGLISLADLGTIGALHGYLRRHGDRLVLVAAGTAVVGDLLNIVGRLAQASLVPVAGASSGELAPAAALALDALERTFNTAGFLLVATAFGAFGVLFLRAGHRALGGVAIVAAGCTAVGQIPGTEFAFYVANVAFLLWYGALFRLFGRPRPATDSPR